ncbi:MAG: XRE family transcriptional regulator, partial [Actinomycetota bacterium]
WLFDRLIDAEVKERRSAGAEEAGLSWAAQVSPRASWTLDPRSELIDADTGAGGTVSAGEFEPVLEVAGRMGWLGSVNVEANTLDLVHRAAEDVVARYEAEGPLRLVPEVVRLRRHVQGLLHGHQHPRQRRRLYGLAARLSGLLGYMAVNCGKFLFAEAYCAEAFALATDGEDPDLQAWVRGTESLSAYYQKRYADALEAARDGQRHARRGPQAIRLAINGEARALGRLGDRRGVDEAVERAYARLSELPARGGLTPCISFEPYSEARVAANAATAYLSLGATSKVLDYAAQIESPVEESDSDWSRSLVRLDVATALIRQRQPDVEHVAEVGMRALQASAAN